MYIGFRNDRESLGYLCLKDIESGNQVTVITCKVGMICIAITIAVNSRSSLFINDQVYLDLSRPYHERLISSSSNQKIQNPNINTLAELEELDLLEYDSGQVILVKDSHTPGDLGKFGPGSKARGKAKSNPHPPSAMGKSGSVFVDGFPLKPLTHNPYRHRSAHKVQTQLEAQNRPDRSKSQMSDVTIKVKKEEVQFETPQSLTDRVQNLDESKRIGTLEKEIGLPKKQIYRKYKHHFEFKNPDGSPIKDKKEFRESQIRFVQKEDTYISKAIHISKDHDPQDTYVFIDDETRQVVQANPNGDSLDYVSSRRFSEEDYERFKGHGVIGEDWDRLNDVSFIRHGMNAQDVLNHMNQNDGEF